MEDAPLSISDAANENQGPDSTVEDVHEVIEDLHPEDFPEDSSTDNADVDDDPTPTVPQRVSTRNRSKPKWTEDYVMSHQIQSPEWLQRANYLQSLMASGVFESVEKDSAKALIAIITGK